MVISFHGLYPADSASFMQQCLWLWIVLAIWGYKDAQKRGIENPVLWFIVVLVGGIIGLVIYLVIREGGLGFGKQQAPPPCRFCGGTLTYISQYQRWYCYNCRKYL